MSVNDRVVLAQRCVIVLAAVAVACLVSGKARAQDASTDELLALDGPSKWHSATNRHSRCSGANCLQPKPGPAKLWETTTPA